MAPKRKVAATVSQGRPKRATPSRYQRDRVETPTVEPISFPEVEPRGNSGQRNLSGECEEIFETRAVDIVHVSPMQIISTFDGIGINVPLKLKQKIWEGEFIELAALIKSGHEMEATEGGEGELVFEGGKLVIKKRMQSGVITSIHAWSSAFMVFMSVFLESHPNEIQQLLKYMRDIRLLASRCAAWPWYEEQFRLKKARYPDSSWGVIDNELWLLCMSGVGGSKPVEIAHTNATHPNTGSQPFRATQGPNREGPETRTCWGYNRGKCSYVKCRFAHVCGKCGGRHPTFQCK